MKGRIGDGRWGIWPAERFPPADRRCKVAGKNSKTRPGACTMRPAKALAHLRISSPKARNLSQTTAMPSGFPNRHGGRVTRLRIDSDISGAGGRAVAWDRAYA